MDPKATEAAAAAPPFGQPEPEVTTDVDFSYFENLQNRPMTREDIAKFLFLIGFPLVSFILAVIIMHAYND